MCSLAVKETQAVLDARWTPSAHAIRHLERPDPLCDTRPGSLAPVHALKDGEGREREDRKAGSPPVLVSPPQLQVVPTRLRTRG